jgi:hypothetical protein
MIALIAQKGNIFDATVLTSIAEATVGLSAGLTALDIQIASEAAPNLWCACLRIYLITYENLPT